jgi:transcription antitermination factor NusA-like protein
VAIGKGGQNVRLASKLTGFEIDITADKPAEEAKVESAEPMTVDKVQKHKLKRKSDLENSLLDAINEHGE